MTDKEKNTINELRKTIEQELSSKRYQHTLGVSYTAACLAMAHDADMDHAMIAGLLHDCAKPLKGEEQITFCEKYHLEISEVERQNPSALLHAKVGAHLAQTRYGVTNPDILNAIKYHTTGRPKMCKLEKILYIADYMGQAANKSQILPRSDKWPIRILTPPWQKFWKIRWLILRLQTDRLTP